MIGNSQSVTQRRYSAEEKAQVVRWFVRCVPSVATSKGRSSGSDQWGSVWSRCASESGHADVDHREVPGTSPADAERIRQLEQENRELKRANAILKPASAFFAAELDRPPK